MFPCSSEMNWHIPLPNPPPYFLMFPVPQYYLCFPVPLNIAFVPFLPEINASFPLFPQTSKSASQDSTGFLPA